MDELLFPMFSRFKREMNTNSFNDNLLDDEFLQVFDVSTRDDSQQYESIIDCNLKYFLPDIPKTCEWSLPVHSDDWVISYPSIGKAFFKLFFLENDLYVGMVAHRYFDVVFTCPDCKLIHRKTSAVRELLYRFGFQYMERKTATGYESFPDELAYMSNPNEVLQTKSDWTIENEIIKMLDEDIKKEDERVSSPSQDESNEEEVTEDSSHSTETTEDQTDPWNVDSKILCLEFLIHCMRFYTLLDHMDFFYGETTKSTEEMKTTFSENIAREEFTSEVCNTLINFSN